MEREGYGKGRVEGRGNVCGDTMCIGEGKYIGKGVRRGYEKGSVRGQLVRHTGNSREKPPTRETDV